MRESNAHRALLFGVLCAACAGANVDPRPDQERARSLIEATTGRSEMFDPDVPLLSTSEIDALLVDGLALEEALRLALLNNRRLQAQFLGLGVARADLVQAGLLRNPSLGVGFLIPSGGGRTKLTADLVANIADLWQLPDKQKVADLALAESVYDVSRFAGELVVQTQGSYFESVAARELAAHAQESVNVSRSMLEAVQERVHAGVATIVEANIAHSQLLAAELAARRADVANSTAKRRLAALLSLEQDLVSVELVDPLPEPSPTNRDRESLVARARASRLDVRAAEAGIRTADAQVELERRRVWPTLDIGLSAERPEGGSSTDLLAGPTVSTTLPIFDRNTAQIRRAQFRREQLQREYEALVADVTQDVRAASDRAASAAQSARFVSDELLPQAERSAELARVAYDLGSTTMLALLESRRAALLARQYRIEAFLVATQARIELECAIGAPASSVSGAAAQP
ncbi:MAG: TolC family protein [Planctomycetota bacterium]